MSNSLQLTQVKANTVAARLQKISGHVLETTISLAFHTFSGNMHSMKAAPQGEARYLDNVYRQFVCATFSVKENKWVFNASKSKKLRAELSLDSNGVTFDQFVDAIVSSTAAKDAAKAALAIEESALDPIAKLDQDKAKVTKYLMNCGLTEIQLRDIILGIDIERSKANLKSIAAPSAAA
jgi:hypothetical protein